MKFKRSDVLAIVKAMSVYTQNAAYCNYPDKNKPVEFKDVADVYMPAYAWIAFIEFTDPDAETLELDVSEWPVECYTGPLFKDYGTLGGYPIKKDTWEKVGLELVGDEWQLTRPIQSVSGPASQSTQSTQSTQATKSTQATQPLETVAERREHGPLAEGGVSIKIDLPAFWVNAIKQKGKAGQIRTEEGKIHNIPQEVVDMVKSEAQVDIGFLFKMVDDELWRTDHKYWGANKDRQVKSVLSNVISAQIDPADYRTQEVVPLDYTPEPFIIKYFKQNKKATKLTWANNISLRFSDEVLEQIRNDEQPNLDHLFDVKDGLRIRNDHPIWAGATGTSSSGYYEVCRVRVPVKASKPIEMFKPESPGMFKGVLYTPEFFDGESNVNNHFAFINEDGGLHIIYNNKQWDNYWEILPEGSGILLNDNWYSEKLLKQRAIDGKIKSIPFDLWARTVKDNFKDAGDNFNYHGIYFNQTDGEEDDMRNGRMG